jgi:hypothetical protein
LLRLCVIIVRHPLSDRSKNPLKNNFPKRKTRNNTRSFLMIFYLKEKEKKEGEGLFY